MEAKPCGICKSTDLRPLYMSDTGEKWIACDKCGNHSKPIVSDSRNVIINQWNKEQEK